MHRLKHVLGAQGQASYSSSSSRHGSRSSSPVVDTKWSDTKSRNTSPTTSPRRPASETDTHGGQAKETGYGGQAKETGYHVRDIHDSGQGQTAVLNEKRCVSLCVCMSVSVS